MTTKIAEAYCDALTPREGWEAFRQNDQEWEAMCEMFAKPYDAECRQLLEDLPIDEDTSSLTDDDWEEVWNTLLEMLESLLKW